MEQLVPQAFNPHLKKVLKTYQTAAERSLSGPQNYMSAWGNAMAKLTPAEMEQYRKILSMQQKIPIEKGMMDVPGIPYLGPVNIQQMPMFIAPDTTVTEKTETILEGDTIACFIVGGEKRLCLPQILNTVLRDFSLLEINNVCDELHIYCSRCSADQLEILKVTNVLPVSAPSCGLITKTDAERLCNALLHRELEKPAEPPSSNSFKVYHECFGKCKGIFSPELYNNPHAKCIECTDCHGLFSPQKFVCHSHKSLENRTCHWGFDSANWRAYLLLAKEQEYRERAQHMLEDMKARFDFMSRYKRKESQADDQDSSGKRARYEENSTPRSYESEQPSWAMEGGHYRQVSAFRPWSPSMLNVLKDGKYVSDPSLSKSVPSFLHTGPPVLLNPERVVPFSEKQTYDRHFAPNVSLAPQVHIKEEKEEKVSSRVALVASPEEFKPPPDLLLSSSSSSVSSCTPSPCKAQPSLDTEVSDHDHSPKSESVPTTPREGVDCVLMSSREESNFDTCVEMLKMALDGKVGNSAQDKGKFVQEFMSLRIKDDVDLGSLAQSRKEKLEELRRIDKQLAEMIEIKNNLKKEIESLQSSQNERIRRLTQDNHRFVKELEEVKIAQKPKEDSALRIQLESYKTRLKQQEKINQHLCAQIAKMRNQLTQSGHDPATDCEEKSAVSAGQENGMSEEDAETDTAEEGLGSPVLSQAPQGGPPSDPVSS